MQLAETKKYSVSTCEPGFADRLNNLLDGLSMRVHGRFTVIEKWCEISNSGARLLFKENRPPKQNTFELLIKQIYSENKRKFDHTKVTENDIAHYLLHGGRNPIPGTVEKTPSREKGDLDPLVMGNIYLTVANLAKDIGLDVFEDIERNQLKILYNKVTELHTERGIELDSTQMSELVKVLLKAAQSYLL